jgi:vibriolysin
MPVSHHLRRRNNTQVYFKKPAVCAKVALIFIQELKMNAFTKALVAASLAALSCSALSATRVILNNTPLSSTAALVSHTPRQQQSYQGLPIIGATTVQTINALGHVHISGIQYHDIHISAAQLSTLNTKSALTAATTAIVKSFMLTHKNWGISTPKLQLVLAQANGTLQPMYQLTLNAKHPNRIPKDYVGLYFVKTGFPLFYSWNKNHAFAASIPTKNIGPGGNGNTAAYHYGNGNVPALNVIQNGTQCTMQDAATNPTLKVVDLSGITDPDTMNNDKTAYTFACNDQKRDSAFGAYSPADDAYVFGNLVRNMYKTWYGISILPNNEPLVLRVHYAELNCDSNGQHCKRMNTPNAFWDDSTQTMNFEDGIESDAGFPASIDWELPLTYPFVAPEITGHEMSHGFTAHHAVLNNSPQAQALNESFSDMAGATTEAYLMQTDPDLYKDIYGSMAMNWEIGKTIERPANKPPETLLAVRFMNTPYKDGHSADCYLKEKTPDGFCRHYYSDVLSNYTSLLAAHPNAGLDRTTFIAHYANGIFNRLFYLLVTEKQWPIKNTFAMMIDANEHYWTAGTPKQTDFFATIASCGIIDAANNMPNPAAHVTDVKAVMDQLHIPYSSCKKNT